jgi:acid phosphatase family membrane protein YuiD
VKISISRDGGSTWTAITPTGGIPNTHSYSWVVTGRSTRARIKVSTISTPTVYDKSDANFTISAGTITVTSPNGGETWYIGDSDNITWNSIHVTGNVKISISRDGGTNWSVITPTGGIPNTNSYSWAVIGPATTKARIKVSTVATPTVFDNGDANFIISSPP